MTTTTHPSGLPEQEPTGQLIDVKRLSAETIAELMGGER